MSETYLERAESFFATPDRCRQQYLEAWKIGHAVYVENSRLKGEVEKEKKRADGLETALKHMTEAKEELFHVPAMNKTIGRLTNETRDLRKSLSVSAHTELHLCEKLFKDEAASKQKDLDLSRLKDKLEGAEYDRVKAVKDLARMRELVEAQEGYMAMQRFGRPIERVMVRLEKAKAALAPSPTKEVKR